MNGEEDAGPRTVVWGTAALKSGFNGIVRKSVIQKAEKSFDGKPPADQLYWEIEPTSYEAEDPEKWPKAWYNISESTRSKWAKVQERLEVLKCLPKKDASDLEGLEFEFERVDLEFGTNRDGVKMRAEQVLLPKKLIRDHRKAPVKAEKKEKTEEKAEGTSEGKSDIDLESMILEAVEEKPIVLADFYKHMNKNYGVSRTEVFRKMKSLQNQGLVKLDTDGNMLVKVSEEK